MATPYLVPSLHTLRAEFNALAPARDKASDGWIGDTAHSSSVSDHNPAPNGGVHAIDVDEDLRVPGLTMERCVQFLLARCRSGAENRLKYVIYERRIWSASGGWREQDYTGQNAHDKHAHFSSKYGTIENDTRSWHLEDIPVAITADDLSKIRIIVREEVDKRVDALIASATPAPTAEQNAEAVWHRVRNDQRSLLSDTAVNLTEARITEALVAGTAIERYPANEGK